MLAFPGAAMGSKLTVKGAPASAEQRRILTRALHLADRWNAPYKAKVALVEALIIESEAKNLKSASGDGYGSYGVLQGRDIYHSRSDLMDPDYQVGVFLGKGRGGKKNPKGFTGKGNAIQLAKTGMKSGDIAQAIEGSAYPDRYQQVQKEAMAIIRHLGGRQLTGPVKRVGAAGVTPKKDADPGFDAEGYQQAVGRQRLAEHLTKRNPNSLLAKTGVLSTKAPDPAAFVKDIPSPVAKPAAAKPTAVIPGRKKKSATTSSEGGGLTGDITKVGGYLEKLTGLPVTARQEPGHAVGGDHDPSVRGATARDFGGDETARKAAFLKLTRQLGIKNAVYKGADINVTKNGLRYQIISRDHGSGPHLHAGVRKA